MDVKNKIVTVSAVVLVGASISGGIAVAKTLEHPAASHSSVVDSPEADDAPESGDTLDAPDAADVPEPGDIADAPGQ